MPFDCGNTTLPYPDCSTLLGYCNNHYGTIPGWCHCMATVDVPICNNYQGMSSSQIIVIIMVCSIIGGPIGLILLAYIIKQSIFIIKSSCNFKLPWKKTENDASNPGNPGNLADHTNNLIDNPDNESIKLESVKTY